MLRSLQSTKISLQDLDSSAQPGKGPHLSSITYGEAILIIDGEHEDGSGDCAASISDDLLETAPRRHYQGMEVLQRILWII